MNEKFRRPLHKRNCPSCGAEGSILEIAYGLPSNEFDFEKYIVGGCVVSDFDSNIGCRECAWRGLEADFN